MASYAAPRKNISSATPLTAVTSDQDRERALVGEVEDLAHLLARAARSRARPGRRRRRRPPARARSATGRPTRGGVRHGTGPEASAPTTQTAARPEGGGVEPVAARARPAARPRARRRRRERSRSTTALRRRRSLLLLVVSGEAVLDALEAFLDLTGTLLHRGLGLVGLALGLELVVRRSPCRRPPWPCRRGRRSCCWSCRRNPYVTSWSSSARAQIGSGTRSGEGQHPVVDVVAADRRTSVR